MLKKYRNEDIDIWLINSQHLMETERATKARQLLQRALQSIPKTNRK